MPVHSSGSSANGFLNGFTVADVEVEEQDGSGAGLHKLGLHLKEEFESARAAAEAARPARRMRTL